MKNAKWLNLAEYLVLIGSGFGSIAAIASQQIAFTVAPISCLMLLNLLNRCRLDKETLETANVSIAHLDQRLSDEIKTLDQQVRSLPSFVDLASVRKTIQQRQDSAIVQLHQKIAQQLSEIELQDNEQFEQELAHLKLKYTQLSESLFTVSQHLSHLATSDRISGAESAIVELRTEIAQLQTKLVEIATSHKQINPRVMQDQLNQIHRRLSSLPQPFDATALKQEVDGLVKVVGELVPRRELAKLMAEVEKIRQQHQSLEQTVAPLRSINTIMKKQMDTLSAWIANGHPASAVINLEKLQATVTQLEDRLNSKDANLAEMQSQLQAEFERVQHQIQHFDRQQKQLAEWTGRLPEMLDASALQSQIKYLTSRLEVTEDQLAALIANQSNDELKLNADSMQTELKAALNQARSRLIVVFPYPDQITLDDELLQHFQTFLDRGGLLDIGWGQMGGAQATHQARYIYDRTSKRSLKKMLSQLTQLKRNYPTQFRFKVLGTSENFLVCDSTYSILGLQPIVTTSPAFPELAIGLRTQNATVIQGLIDRFDHPKLGATDTIAYLNRAITRYELGDRQGAISDYSTVIALEPEQSISYNNRALIKLELQDHAGAIDDLTAVLSIEAQNPIAYFHRGLVYSTLNDKTSALRDFRKAAWLFSMQGDAVKHQHAIAALEKLGGQYMEVQGLRIVREA